MTLLLQIVLVVVVIGLVVFGVGVLVTRVADRWVGGSPLMAHLLASVLRFFVVLTGCVLLIVRGGEHRVALVSAAGATYFAVVMFEAWRVTRSRPTPDA